MKIKKQIASLLMVMFFSNSSFAQTQFDQVILFGASYLDSGTFADPFTGDTSGLRFTNFDPQTGQRGSSLAELLVSDLGLGALPAATPLPGFVFPDAIRTDGSDAPPSFRGNLNFAVGGFQAAQILTSINGEALLGISPAPIPGFTQRVDLGVFSVSEDALFVINVGGNDIRALADPATTAALSLASFQALADAGAGTIVALNLPELGELAEAANVGPNDGRSALGLARTAGAIQFNTLVDAGLSSIDANIVRVDVATLFNEVLADPGSFGFSTAFDQTSFCFDATPSPFRTVCNEAPGLGFNSGGNPDDFIFDDGLHPTQRTAQISADFIESILRAPSQISLIAEAGYSALTQHQSSLRSHLSGLRFDPKDVGVYQFFSNAQNTERDLESTSTTVAADSDSDYINVGFTYRTNANWTFGGALGYVDQEVDVDVIGTEFENDGFLLSGLATYERGSVFIEAGLTYANLDVESNRGVLLGITQRVETGDSDGDGIGLTFAIGQNFLANSNLRAGPIFRLDYNYFDVSSFSEEGARSTSLSFSNIERSSLIGGVGAFANYAFLAGNTPIQLFGEALLEADLESGADPVTASLNSLGNTSNFSLESFDTDSVSYSLQLGASAQLTNSTAAQISYTYQDLAGDIDAINFGIRTSF